MAKGLQKGLYTMDEKNEKKAPKEIKVWKVAGSGTTQDLSIFKTLDGNRSVQDGRVAKIVDSIETSGYVPVLIVVNERMQIIDGQGRKEAARLLNLPLSYIVVPGAGLDECIHMNISSTSWNTLDFIETWAGRLSDYARLKSLLAHGYTLDVTYCAITGKQTVNAKQIKSGEFTMDEEHYRFALEILGYLDQFKGLIKRHKIKNKKYLYTALCICKYLPEVDDEHLLSQMEKYGDQFTSATQSDEVIRSLEDIYRRNTRGKKRKTFITAIYKRWQGDNNHWYESRYGSRYER